MLEENTSQDSSAQDPNDFDADALLAQIERGEEVNAPQAPQAPVVEEFEIPWRDKKIKADREKVINWASQGYDYSQKMADVNKRLAESEQLKKTLEQQYSPYKTLDEYAKQNPDWWNHVTQSYENRSSYGQKEEGAIPAALAKEIQELKDFKNNLNERFSNEQRQKEDQALSQEVDSIRKQYPDLDFDTVDDSGYSLEQRVMKHAVENGINSFRAAFRDYNHENLLKLAQEKAQEKTAKTFQTRNKQGHLGSTPTATKGLSRAENVKAKSYNDLRDEALSELGLL